MGISAYKEVTQWDSEFPVPNHTYLFDGKSNILAYAKESNDEVFVFKKPLPLDNRRRKFVKVTHKALDKLAKTFTIEEPKVEVGKNWVVKGSKGNVYKVILKDGRYICNCVGYSYRGTCTHSKQIEEKNVKS
jgi:hypothetical protein